MILIVVQITPRCFFRIEGFRRYAPDFSRISTDILFVTSLWVCPIPHLLVT